MRKLFFISGVLFSLFFVLLIGVELLVNSKNFNYNSLLFFSMAIFSFSHYYIFAHLNENDERSKEIKFKSASYSFLVVLFLAGISILFITINPVLIEVINLLKIFITIFIIIYSNTIIIISKRI
ncbi:hypothetical protein RJD24_19680 [Bacillaceae bacterium IKA-2]|nr:hypothetical protein RJD24_19680 [Bacillaceae bacterium IKA-2]